MNKYKLWVLLILLGLCGVKAEAQSDTTGETHTKIDSVKKEKKLKVGEKKNDKNKAKWTDPCDSLTVRNFFGEVPSSYTKHTIVYVYNFSEKLAQRRFYKITRKNADSLNDPDLVNLATETLPTGADVYLKLVNINKYMYDITLSDTTVGFETLPSALFSKSLSGDTVLTSILNSSLGAQQGSSGNSNDPSLERLKDDIIAWTNERDSLLRKMTEAYSPCAVFPCCNPKDAAHFDTLADFLSNIRERAAAFVTTYNKASKELREPQFIASSNHDTLQKVNLDESDVSTYGSVMSLLASLPSEPDIRRAIVFVNNMVQRNQQELYPLSTEGSYLDITINIRSKDSIVQFFSIPLYNDPPLHYRIPILFKPFFTFSTGPFVGIDSRLKNKTYAWQAIPDNTNAVQPNSNYLLVENGYTEPPFGFALYGNLQWRLCRNFGVGPSGGIGLTAQSHVAITPLAGVSAFIGNIGQLVVTGGIMGLGINTLSNQWKDVYNHQTIYSAPQTLSYYKAFNFGAFVSVTYTPFHQ